MTRLTDTERQEFQAAARQKPRANPPPPRRPLKAYLEFATFASRFDRAIKPVRFTGAHWKL